MSNAQAAFRIYHKSLTFLQEKLNKQVADMEKYLDLPDEVIDVDKLKKMNKDLKVTEQKMAYELKKSLEFVKTEKKKAKTKNKPKKKK